jgi:hypothetical protein
MLQLSLKWNAQALRHQLLQTIALWHDANQPEAAESFQCACDIRAPHATYSQHAACKLDIELIVQAVLTLLQCLNPEGDGDLVEEAQDLAADLFPAGLLMVHDPC